MTTAAAVLGQLLDPVITPESAGRIVAIQADPELQLRLDELGEKSNEGLLTPAEREEYAAYVVAIDVIAILQAKSRRLLRDQEAS